MNVADALDRNTIFFPDHEALVEGDRRWTYLELRRDADRFAHALLELGVEKGDRVCLLLTNSAEFVIAFYGILKVGAIATSLSGMSKREELVGLLTDCGGRVVITDPHHMAELPDRAEMPSVETVISVGEGAGTDHEFWTLLDGQVDRFETVYADRDDGAEIIYTGGTTGRPKGVVLTHGNVVSNTHTTVSMTGLQPEDRCLCFLPMYHSFAQNFIMNSVICGAATLLVMPKFEFEPVMRIMAENAVTRWFAVPTIYILVLGAEDTQAVDRAFQSVDYCFAAASSMPGAVAKRWKERFGLDVNEGYGLTETTPFSTYNHRYRHKEGTVGTPVDFVEVQVWDENDRRVPAGHPGQIVIKGPNCMKGYFNNPEATAETMMDGWVKTGDIGIFDDEGYLRIVDRVKDMVNSAGLKIWPREVEEVLYRHAGVEECAVIGVPDPVFGESVKACVVVRPGVEVCADDLIAYCKEHLASYKAPRTVEFLPSLPKSGAGKVLKTELRQAFVPEED